MSEAVSADDVNVDKFLNGVQLTASEESRYASIRRVAISSRKTEDTRHADAMMAIDVREYSDLKQLASAVGNRLNEQAGKDGE